MVSSIEKFKNLYVAGLARIRKINTDNIKTKLLEVTEDLLVNGDVTIDGNLTVRGDVIQTHLLHIENLIVGDDSSDIATIKSTLRITNNLFYIKYAGPDGDQYIYFYEGGSPTGASIKWDNTLQRFVFSHPVEATIIGGVFNQMVFYEDSTLTLKVGAGKPMTIVVPFDCTVIEVYGHVETAPTGANIIVDVNLNGTSIWATTPGNRLNIAAGATTGSKTAFDTSNFDKDDELQIDIDQIGSIVAGTDLGVYIRIKPR